MWLSARQSLNSCEKCLMFKCKLMQAEIRPGLMGHVWVPLYLVQTQNFWFCCFVFFFFFPKLCAKILFGLCYTGSIWVNSQTDFRKVIILVCLSTLLQAGFPLTDVLAVRIKISKTGSEINLPSLADSVLDRGWFICNYLMMFLNWQF